MKGSIRVSAKTLDDAITEALIQLGVTSDRLEYNVIEKGSAGFLGIGMKQAVIEAWKKEDKEEEEFLKAVEETIRENPVKEYFVKEDDVKEHQAEEAAGKEIMYGYDVLGNSENIISCVKILNKLNTSDKIGLLILQINKNTMRNVIGQFPTDGGVSFSWFSEIHRALMAVSSFSTTFALGSVSRKSVHCIRAIG